MSSLPLELLYTIADELGAECWNSNIASFQALVQLSLVSSGLRSYILTHMFMTIHIASHISANALRGIMRENVFLGRHVHRLRLFRRETREVHEDLWKTHPPSLEALLPSLPHLSALEIVNQFYFPLIWAQMGPELQEPLRHLLESRRLTSLVLTDISGFPESLLIQTLDTLKSLSLNNILFDEEQEIDPTTLPRKAVPLESLRITGSMSVFYLLCQHHSLSTLRLKDLRRFEVSAFVKAYHGILVEPAAELIHGVADTLEELEIDARPGRLSQSYIAVQPDLGYLPKLRTVKFNVPAWRTSDPTSLTNIAQLVSWVLEEATGTCPAQELHLVTSQALGKADPLHHLKSIPAPDWEELDQLLRRPEFSPLRSVVFEVQVGRMMKGSSDSRQVLVVLNDLKSTFPRWLPLLCASGRITIRLKVNDLYTLL